ncbi:tetratricopeptide repeat (TPR)-like superfamily protein [Actinidia rufa]|uniref:Tetratricopeptide repeat (TPR)-like superfamily protein n=1 Tax=Actinidia rufa TaxID=165716 RepID=A0A7J0GU92_9ERIC|nr:tetratricopeptide repeat (TPR)-like superfamily protein [Actinidia rufa]
MLAPRKFLQRRRKLELFKDAADEADQKNWRKLMNEIDETGSAVSVLRNQVIRNKSLPKDLIVGTLVRFKQLKKWNLVSEILEWLRIQHWWDFNEMDFLMLITAHGKQGDFNKAEMVFSYMNKKGYAPNVISLTALMEAYGRGGQYNKAETIFRRMQSSGPEPSAVTYQIILKTFVEGDKFEEAEVIFETLLNEKSSPLRPDQKMFHMMIYMFRKAGSYAKARKIFALMAERGVQRSTVTFNSLMSFETNYKEVASIYNEMKSARPIHVSNGALTKEGIGYWHLEQKGCHHVSVILETMREMHRADIIPDVVSYALLVNAYGKARKEEEALAVFEEMLDAGVRPTQKAYNILLDAFAISGMVEQARIVFKSMRRDRCTPDLCSYTTMLSAYVNASDMEGAEKFFRRIKQDGLEPNIVTYGTLIKGYAKVSNLEKMMEKYDEMRLCGIKSNQTVFTTMMDAYGKNKDFDSAVGWFKEMESCGVPPDQKAKNIILSLARTAEEQTEASQLVGHSYSHADKEKADSFHKLVDDDDDDDENDDDEDDDYDDYYVENTISFDEEDDESIISKGVHQRKRGVLDAVKLDAL